MQVIFTVTFNPETRDLQYVGNIPSERVVPVLQDIIIQLEIKKRMMEDQAKKEVH
jgi:hypothetical protein